MIQVAITAFTMGTIGSFHCIGMCGPLALSLPLGNSSAAAKFTGTFLYNAGRIVTYSMFGLLFGLIGQSAAFFGFQQWLSLILGTAIILILVLPKIFPTVQVHLKFGDLFFQKIRIAVGNLFSKRSKSSLFIIGLLNGLLPCGFVYLAIAGAISAGGVMSSILFMACFGMGTLPVMWSIAFWGNFIGIGIRQKIRKAYPAMMTMVACLLILRGLGLGIAHISPGIDPGNKKIIECHVKQ